MGHPDRNVESYPLFSGRGLDNGLHVAESLTNSRTITVSAHMSGLRAEDFCRDVAINLSHCGSHPGRPSRTVYVVFLITRQKIS